MEPKPYENVFKAIHKRIAAVKDKMREEQRTANGARQRNAREEATREGFDRPVVNTPGTPSGETIE
jgi:hypothetical protein